MHRVSGSQRKLSALLGAFIMVVSVMGGPVGAETLAGGTASAGNVGTTPGLAMNDATTYDGSASTIEVAYDRTGLNDADHQIVLLDGGKNMIDSNASLSAPTGVVELTIPKNMGQDFTATAVLVNTATSTSVARTTAAITVKDVKYAPWVNQTDTSHDSTTKTTLRVPYNATGQVASASDIGIQITDGMGTVYAGNGSLSTTEGEALVTIAAGTFSSDTKLSVAVVDTSVPSKLATDAFSLTTSGGGDTTSPTISNVQLTNASGNMLVSFVSDEQLGASASDVSVTVGGPNGKTYTFDRSQFTEKGSGPYTYESSVTQAFDDGAGTYGASVGDAKDAAGNNGGMNGDGSGLTASADYKIGGGDTTPPTISNVQFTNASGNMLVSFASDEQLGASASDVSVTVGGPNGKTYTFDRSQFTEKGSGPYTYESSVTQAFDDGAGTYDAYIADAKDAAGNNGGLNGGASGLIASADYKTGGGGGSDTAAPNITQVDVTKTFDGKISVTFYSNETLGSNAGDVTVTVDGPKTTDLFTFDRTQFSQIKRSNGYQYRLRIDQAFSEGDGYYNATVDAATDGAGNTAGGTHLNDSYEYIKKVVKSSSLRIVSGPGDETKLKAHASYSGGLLQLQVKDDSSSYELEDVGVTKNTKIELTATVKSKKPRALIGNGQNVNWTRTENKDGTWTITVTGTPSETDYYFPSPNKWTGSLQATEHRNVSMTFAADTLAGWPDERRKSMSGIVFMTDAQQFGPPTYDDSGANPRIEFDVSAPHFNKSGMKNYGFAEVYLPQSLLDYWGVKGSAIAGEYNGKSRSTTITDVANGGVQASVDVHYSSGTAAFTVDSTAPNADAGSDVTAEAGNSVNFDASSSSDNRAVDTYEWDFDGDGVTDATGATASKTFSTPGTYTVTLTVTDAAGNSDTDTRTVTVQDTIAPTASIGSDRSITEGDSVSFDASGSMDLVGITSYSWDFDDDGVTDATGATPTHTFSTAGTFTVTLTVSDAAGNTDTATLTVDVSEPSTDSGGSTSVDTTTSEQTTTEQTTTSGQTTTEQTTTSEQTTTEQTTTSEQTTVEATMTTEATTVEQSTVTDSTESGSTTTEPGTTPDDDSTTVPPTEDSDDGDANDGDDTTTASDDASGSRDTSTMAEPGPGDGSPGFGLVVALVALVAAALVAVRRGDDA
jgi:PGF-CTERM protein